jgi:hypothetical protein
MNENQYFIEICASNSLNHRHHGIFKKWLSEAIENIPVESDSTKTNLRSNPKIEQWIEKLIDKDHMITGDILDYLENSLLDSFVEIGELIASVDYDHDGMGHSGWNGVYEFCGLYIIQGSDYSEGPTTDKYYLLEFLDTSNPEHDVFWTDFAD